jgi:hypothetical protein
MMHAPAVRPTLAILLLLLPACGGESRPGESPRQRVTVEAVPTEPLTVSVSREIDPGPCQAVTGDVIRRQGLHGVEVLTDPGRGILVLFDTSGQLAFYRDMIPGRQGGYTVRLDMMSDSGFVLDRATRVVVRGPVAAFRTRPELGPPDSLAAQLVARCAAEANGR